MIMLHPDYRSGTYQEFQQTRRSTTFPDRRTNGDLRAELQDIQISDSPHAWLTNRAALHGQSGLVLVFAMGILLRSMW